MKTVCDFCKTEYSLDALPVGPVKCAVCGNTWVVQRESKRNPILVFIAALCALLAAIVFAVAVLYQNQVKEIQEKPIIAEISGIDTSTDDNGIVRFVVSGRVVNRSEQIYGVPGVVIISYDANGRVIDRQRFMPSATLLEGDHDAAFKHVLAVPTDNVDKIAVELDSQEK